MTEREKNFKKREQLQKERKMIERENYCRK